jgi:hypothetical protein
MKKETIANKDRAFGLYGLAFERIKQCKSNNSIIAFPDVFEKLCRSFSIKKKEAWELIFVLRDFGFIEVVRFHGVIVK